MLFWLLMYSFSWKTFLFDEKVAIVIIKLFHMSTGNVQ